MKTSPLLSLCLFICCASSFVFADSFEKARVENFAKATELSNAWDRVKDDYSSEDARYLAAKDLLAFWDAQLNIAYKRGLSQYPKTAKEYKLAQRAWLEYRESFVWLHRTLTANRKQSFIKHSGSCGDEQALLAMLTMCRVSELLSIEVSRSWFTNKECMGSFSIIDDESDAKETSDELLSYISACTQEAVSTADMLNQTYLECGYYDSRLKLVILLLEDALPNVDEEGNDLASETYKLYQKYHKLDEASVAGEFVAGMVGSMHTLCDAANWLSDVKVSYLIFSSLLNNKAFQFCAGVEPRKD